MESLIQNYHLPNLIHQFNATPGKRKMRKKLCVLTRIKFSMYCQKYNNKNRFHVYALFTFIPLTFTVKKQDLKPHTKGLLAGL
jgi:hypothetical protein